ncbi:Uncharacterised protein [uncultured archaeon]|nr:Uncharacterised protein [uncultured archaeon]
MHGIHGFYQDPKHHVALITIIYFAHLIASPPISIVSILVI